VSALVQGRTSARPATASQTNPSKTKPHQIDPSKIAWFYLVLFVRIEGFQWVTANPNKKFAPCLNVSNVTRVFTSCSPLLLAPVPRRRRFPKMAFDQAQGKRYSIDSVFRKGIA
jgi:hypothetical protein